MSERWIVLGAGIAGLAFAHRALARRPDLDLLVLEGSDRPGGMIRTDRAAGFACEWGPIGVLDNAPETLALAAELGIEERWLVRHERTKLRFIEKDGKLQPLPASPVGLLSSPLLTWGGKLRLLREPWIGRRPENSKPETLADFARRRLGEEAYRNLFDPFVTGIFAGDPEELEAEACLPKLARAEAEHGSLFAWMRKGGRPPVLRSFRDGMDELPRALARVLGDRLQLGAPVEGVSASGDGFAVRIGGARPESLAADRVVCCLPADAAAHVLLPVDSAFGAELAGIPTVPVVSIHLGLDQAAAEGKIRGFGYLVPKSAGSPVLGCLFTSEIFAGRAPEGRAAVRYLLGGARAPGILAAPDADLLAICRDHLRTRTGYGGEIRFHLVQRIERAIPQYVRGHQARLERLDALLERHPGLHLLGASYRGVSVNDGIEHGRALADRLTQASLRNS